MKAKELMEMTDEELDEKLVESKKELFELRFQAATGGLENHTRLRLAKRDIARILTVRHERALEKTNG
jgi:large subunit ribosomal protein L29